MKNVPRDLIRGVLLSVALIVCYVLIGRSLQRLGLLEFLFSYLRSEGIFISMTIYWLIVVISLLTPLSSASLLVVLGVSVFGPVPTFGLTYTAAIVAGIVSYLIGLKLR